MPRERSQQCRRCLRVAWCGLVADEYSIGHLVPCGSIGGHFVRWHTGDSETLDLAVKLTPVLDNLVHDAIVLTLHALGSLALAFLTEIHDRLHCILGVDLDLVVRVLDDGDGHGVPC